MRNIPMDQQTEQFILTHEPSQKMKKTLSEVPSELQEKALTLGWCVSFLNKMLWDQSL